MKAETENLLKKYLDSEKERQTLKKEKKELSRLLDQKSALVFQDTESKPVLIDSMSKEVFELKMKIKEFETLNTKLNSENKELADLNLTLNRDVINLKEENINLSLKLSMIQKRVDDLVSSQLQYQNNEILSIELNVEICLLKKVIMSILEATIDDESILNNISKELKYSEEEYSKFAESDFIFNIKKNVMNFKSYVKLCKTISELGRNSICANKMKNKNQLQLAENEFTSLKQGFKELKARCDQLGVKMESEISLRRELHHRYINLRGNLKIMARVRPHQDGESNQNDFYVVDCEKLIIQDKSYELDYILDKDSSQVDVLNEVAPVLQSLIRGRNVCFISYGQTGTGKTYTIQGKKTESGLAVNIARELFNLLKQDEKHIREEAHSKAGTPNFCRSNSNCDNESNQLIYNYSNKQYLRVEEDRQTSVQSEAIPVLKRKFSLGVSVIEMYNENIYDLLSESGSNLSIYENTQNNVIIPDLIPVEVSNICELEKVIKLASKLRQTSSTNFNERSSRSHLIITYYLKIHAGDIITKSKLHIIDLAGSERLSRNTNPIDDQQKLELSFIHTSLNSLSNVLNAIALKQNHVPYRDSKLTHFLKDCLTDAYNIVLLLHVSPDASDRSETLSTLDFGNRLAKLCKYKLGK